MLLLHLSKLDLLSLTTPSEPFDPISCGSPRSDSSWFTTLVRDLFLTLSHHMNYQDTSLLALTTPSEPFDPISCGSPRSDSSWFTTLVRDLFLTLSHHMNYQDTSLLNASSMFDCTNYQDPMNVYALQYCKLYMTFILAQES